MDERRLSTGEVLRSGILNITPRERLIPNYADFHQLALDDEEINIDYIKVLLEKGGIQSSQDYGCWAICKTDDGYIGELMQYRARTEEFHGYSLDDATKQAYTWYRTMW